MYVCGGGGVVSNDLGVRLRPEVQIILSLGEGRKDGKGEGPIRKTLQQEGGGPAPRGRRPGAWLVFSCSLCQLLIPQGDDGEET